MIEDSFGKKKIYYGSMKSGKSSSLAREAERFNDHRKRRDKDFDILIFKPVIDDRVLGEEDSETKVSTRDGKSFEAIPVKDSQEILEKIEGGKKQFIGIDEVMFLDSGIVDVVKELDKDPNKYLVLTGLDKCYRGGPFPFTDYKKDMYDLINLFEPEERYKIYGWCDNCGRENIGEYTQRYADEEKNELSKYYDPLVVVGDEEYESRCERCFELPPGKEKWIFVSIMISRGDKGEGLELKDLKEGAVKYGGLSEEEFDKIIERMETEKMIELRENRVFKTEILEKRNKNNFWR